MTESTWQGVELELLREVDERERSGAGPLVLVGPGAPDEVSTERIVAMRRLIEGGLLDGQAREAWGGTPVRLQARRVTGEGLKALGRWPVPGQTSVVDDFLAALNEAADETEDEDERSRLRRAIGTAGEVGRDTLAGVLAAVIARQTGIG